MKYAAGFSFLGVATFLMTLAILKGGDPDASIWLVSLCGGAVLVSTVLFCVAILFFILSKKEDY